MAWYIILLKKKNAFLFVPHCLPHMYLEVNFFMRQEYYGIIRKLSLSLNPLSIRKWKRISQKIWRLPRNCLIRPSLTFNTPCHRVIYRNSYDLTFKQMYFYFSIVPPFHPTHSIAFAIVMQTSRGENITIKKSV